MTSVVGIASAALIGVVVAGLSAGPVRAAGRSAAIVDTASYSFAFSPRTLTLHVGDRATWTNQSFAPHNVTFGSFGSADLGTGGKYGHTFTAAGSFMYRCTIHGFTGKVVVLGAAASQTPKATPKPTSKPTATPNPSTSSEPSPSPDITAVPAASSGTPSVAGIPPSAQIAAASGEAVSPGSTSPPSDAASSATGPPIPIIAGLLLAVIVVVGLGAARLVRR